MTKKRTRKPQIRRHPICPACGVGVLVYFRSFDSGDGTAGIIMQCLECTSEWVFLRADLYDPSKIPPEAR